MLFGYGLDRPYAAQVAPTTVEDLADRLSVSAEDLRVILGTFVDPIPDVLDADEIDTVCHQLDPHGERTVPGLYWPGSEDDDPPQSPVNPLALP